MIAPPRSDRRRAEILRSQLALEVALAAYAAMAALTLLRVVFKLIRISDLVWLGATLYGVTDIFLAPFMVLPVGQRPLLADATLADITALGVVTLVPLALLARDRRR